MSSLHARAEGKDPSYSICSRAAAGIRVQSIFNAKL